METKWLEAHLDDPSVRVVEVDEDVTAYGRGHIPGAICWNWNTDLRAAVGRDFIDQETLTGLLRSASVNPDTTVILYAGNNNWFAAYAYWLLKYLGFDAVRLLNGGRKKWEFESRPLTDEVPSYPGGAVSLDASVRTEIRAFRNQVLARLRRGVFVDVRSREEYRGEKLAPDHLPQEQSQVPGHIPGAANIPWSKAANEDGTFKSADDLRALYEDAGVTADPGGHRLLPHRRTVGAHLVRAHRAARLPRRQELRRILDRVRDAGRSPSREGLDPEAFTQREGAKKGATMAVQANQYVSGDWRVRAASEEEFVARWLAFTGWSQKNAPGAESFVLIRDMEQPRHFLSVGTWANLESVRAWRDTPEFARLLGRCRELCEEFHAGDYSLAASPTPAPATSRHGTATDGV